MGQTPGPGQRGLSGWLLLEARGERALGLWTAQSQPRTWSLVWEWGLPRARGPREVPGLEMASHLWRVWDPEGGRGEP